MSEQPLDLRALARTIWRGRLTLGLLGVAGLAIGLSYAALAPPSPQAEALVILPPGAMASTSGSGALDPTQVLIARSAPVLAAAGKAVSPPPSPAQLRGSLRVSALSAQVLQIEVSAPRAGEAAKLANAVANSYIAYVDKGASAPTSTAVTASQAQISALKDQLQDLQSQIDTVTRRLATEKATSVAGQRDATLLVSLRTEQEEVSLQLDTLNNQVVSAELSSSQSMGATRLLQPASPVPPTALRWALYPASGLLVGLVVGCLSALWRARGDRRLRLRDQMASILGVPVVASLECEPCRSVKDWKHLLEKYHPSPTASWNLRRLLYRLSPPAADKAVQVNFVSFANDQASLTAGVYLAQFASELGTSVTLVPDKHRSLSMLRAACAVLGTGASSAEHFQFKPKASTEQTSPAKLTVGVQAVEVVKPVVPSQRGGVILAVSSGFPTADALARFALAVADAGLSIDGVVIVNPDPSDNTAGAVTSFNEGRNASRRLVLSRVTEPAKDALR